MSTKVLVTGGTGFLGVALVEHLLARGWTVHVVARVGSDVSSLGSLPVSNVHVIAAPEEIMRVVGDVRPDIVIHLAALIDSRDSPELISPMIASNILLGTHLVAAMAAHGVTRLIDSGTYAEYFHVGHYLPATLYAATKKAFDSILAYYRDAHDLSTITLKPFNVYGSGERGGRLVKLLVDAANQGKPVDLTPGDQTLDLVHVDDVICAYAMSADLLLASPERLEQTYFVSGERHSLKQVVAKVEKATGKKVANLGRRPYRDREIMMPVNPAPLLPGWRPKKSLDVELGKMLACEESAVQ